MFDTISICLPHFTTMSSFQHRRCTTDFHPSSASFGSTSGTGRRRQCRECGVIWTARIRGERVSSKARRGDVTVHMAVKVV
jgi:hypothetical protein